MELINEWRGASTQWPCRLVLAAHAERSKLCSRLLEMAGSSGPPTAVATCDRAKQTLLSLKPPATGDPSVRRSRPAQDQTSSVLAPSSKARSP